MYRKDFLAIGGHDELFAPQSKEDSDLFNRFVLKGYQVLQSWDGLVYHFTSRGSRFNKHSGGAAGKNSQEWIHTTTKNGRNFIRKWGHFVKHDSLMKPIIPPKYDIGFRLENANEQLLEALEPWCTSMYTDIDFKPYCEKEQPNTQYSLLSKMYGIEDDITNDITLSINGKSLTQQDYQIIQQLSEIIQDSGEIGEFELGNLKVTITQIREYQDEFIHL